MGDGVGWGGVWWGGVGGVGRGKKHHLGHPMSSHGTHTVANGTIIVGHIVSGSKPRSPHLTLDTLGMDRY